MITRRSVLRMAGASLLGSATAPVALKSALLQVGRSFGGFYFGWIPDAPSAPKPAFTRSQGMDATFPNRVDLRPGMPEVYDQQSIGSCTSNAIAAAVQYVRKKAGQRPDFRPSRLFLYYNGRNTENSIAVDNGISITDGIGAVKEHGVCDEDAWPYDAIPADLQGNFPSNSRAVVKPRRAVYAAALPHRAIDATTIITSGADRLRDM